jgi:gas vesicle protein
MKEELENKKQEGSVLVPFLVGGLVGAGVALLLAPKSGRELRHDIKDMASSTRDSITSAVERGKDLFESGRSAIKTAVETGKSAYIEERDKHLKAA